MDAQVNHPKYWMPLVWAGSIVQRARKENRIPNDYMMLALIEQIDKFRGMAGGCLNYDWINIPMVYTQVKSYELQLRKTTCKFEIEIFSKIFVKLIFSA